MCGIEAFVALRLQGGITTMAAGLTKTALVRLLAEKLETSNKTAALFLTTLAEIAVKETKKNEVFVLPGLGRLKKSARKARIGRNPQTGEPIKIPAKTVVKFYVGKAVKDAIAPPKKK
jgi:DNA-binding protein HU-beta